MNAKCHMPLDLDCVVDVHMMHISCRGYSFPVLKRKDLYVGEARVVHLALGFVDVQRWSLG